MKKIIIMICVIVLCFNITACSSNQEIQNEAVKVEKEIDLPQVEEKEETKIDNIDEIRSNMTKWAKAIKNVFIDRSGELSRGFDNSKNQVLLISSSNDIALLINSQNESVAPSDEIVEYSAKSLQSSALESLTSSFSQIQFNEHKTYVFNVDFWGTMMDYTVVNEDMFSHIFKSIIHEGIHILKQDGEPTMEEAMSTRSQSAEENVEARYYRNEMGLYLKEALQSEGEARIDLIKKANYFYTLFKKVSDNEPTGFDKTEGEATFLAYKALVMANNESLSEKEVLNETIKLIINRNNEYIGEDVELSTEMQVLLKFEEPYSIGSYAIALLEQDNLKYETSTSVLCEQLLENYGFTQAKEHQGIRAIVEATYSYSKENNSGVIEKFEKAANDSSYKKVIIPLTDMSSSTTYDGEFLDHNHNDKDGQVVTISKGISHNNGNRIKLDGALAFEYFNDVVLDGINMSDSDLDSEVTSQEIEVENDFPFSYVVLYVHKDDIEYEQGLITIQTNEVLMFDIKAKEIEGGYEIITN
jgi:hypothetical protein